MLQLFIYDFEAKMSTKKCICVCRRFFFFCSCLEQKFMNIDAWNGRNKFDQTILMKNNKVEEKKVNIRWMLFFLLSSLNSRRTHNVFFLLPLLFLCSSISFCHISINKQMNWFLCPSSWISLQPLFVMNVFLSVLFSFVSKFFFRIKAKKNKKRTTITKTTHTRSKKKQQMNELGSHLKYEKMWRCWNTVKNVLCVYSSGFAFVSENVDLFELLRSFGTHFAVAFESASDTGSRNSNNTTAPFPTEQVRNSVDNGMLINFIENVNKFFEREREMRRV